MLLKLNILEGALNLYGDKCRMIHKTDFSFQHITEKQTRVTHLLAVVKFIAEGPGLDPWSGGNVPGKGQAGGRPLNQSH